MISLKIDESLVDLDPDNFIGRDRSLIRYNESPFYATFETVMGSVMHIQSSTKRKVCSVSFTLTHEQRALLRSGINHGLYSYCGELDDLQDDRVISIRFPYPNEIRFNNNILKDNLRGFERQKGTANPANLTPYVNIDSEEPNVLEFEHDILNKEYIMCSYIVKLHSPESLLPKILEDNNIIPIAETMSLLSDDSNELITSSTLISLKCPISITRMRYPVRSNNCRHIECFDALWYLESQKQIPVWTCPICRTTCKINDLVICELLCEIIEECEDSVNQIKLYNDGTWEEINETEGSVSSNDILTIKELKIQQDQIEEEDEIIDLESDQDQPEEIVSIFEKVESNFIGDFFDNDDSRVSLDPNISNISIEPLKLKEPVRPENINIHYMNTRIPNVLGKPPLQNSNDSSFSNEYITSSTSFGSFSFTPEKFTIGNQEPDLSSASEISKVVAKAEPIHLKDTKSINNRKKRMSVLPRAQKLQSLYTYLTDKQNDKDNLPIPTLPKLPNFPNSKDTDILLINKAYNDVNDSDAYI